jgi:hypothetical protein
VSVSRNFVPTNESLTANFERALENAVRRGDFPLSDTGLNGDVDKALRDVALAFPATLELQEKARKAFAEQLRS